MKEYIERGAVLKKNMYGNTAPITHRTYAEMLIQSAPAADVAEVVHGEWETNPDDLYWGNSLKRKYCSVCKNEPHFDREKREFILTDYCPNCGAKMDGGAK